MATPLCAQKDEAPFLYLLSSEFFFGCLVWSCARVKNNLSSCGDPGQLCLPLSLFSTSRVGTS